MVIYLSHFYKLVSVTFVLALVLEPNEPKSPVGTTDDIKVNSQLAGWALQFSVMIMPLEFLPEVSVH